MKHVDSSDANISLFAVGTICSMLRKYKDYIQKYKQKLEKLEKTTKSPQIADMIHDIIMVLEGKR